MHLLFIFILIFSSILNALEFDKSKIYSDKNTNTQEKSQLTQDLKTYNLTPLAPYQKSFFNILTENDAYFNQFVDRYYSAGTSFSFTSKEYLNNWLSYLSYDYKGLKASRYQISLHQDVYTPKSRLPQFDPLEHPYAGYLSIDFSISQRRINSIENLKLQIGVVGPAALAKETQKLIHLITKNPIFYGWKYQIKNEFIFNLTYEYIHKLNLLETKYLESDFLPGFKIALGNANTFMGIGGRIRLGYHLKSDFGVEKVNTGFFGSKPYNDDFSFYVFGGILGSYVARNIFIQGNSIGTPTSLVLKHLIYDAELGISILFRGFRFSYVFTHQSKQFNTQIGAHNFGSIVLNFSF